MLECDPVELGSTSIFSSIFPLVYFIFAKLLDNALSQFLTKDKHFDSEKRKNIIVYVLEIVVTTVSLGLCVFITPNLLGIGDLSMTTLKFLNLIGHLILSLYLFEIAFKDGMHKSLLLHHFSMITLYYLAIIFFQRTEQVWILRAALFLMYGALTEQSTFVGLLLYRFESKWTAIVMKVSSISSILIKTACVVLASYAWVKVNQLFWWIFFPIGVYLMLWPSQIYSSYILWILAKRAHSKFNTTDNTEEAIPSAVSISNVESNRTTELKRTRSTVLMSQLTS